MAAKVQSSLERVKRFANFFQKKYKILWKKHNFAPMKHENDINSAFETFLNWYVCENNGRIPKEIQEAKYAAQGKRRNPLGLNRLISLIEKYAKNVFTVRVSVALEKETGKAE